MQQISVMLTYRYINILGEENVRADSDICP